MLILALAFWILKDRISKALAACSAIAVAGVVLVVFQPGSHASPTGVALTVAGVAACAVYTVLSSKFLADASPLSVVLIQQVAALGFALVVFAGSVILADPSSLSAVSATAWLSAIGAGILYYGVAFWFYVTGLSGTAPGIAGMFINLIPVFGITSSYLFLGERLTGRQWIGAGLILLAVAAITKLRSPAPHLENDSALC